MNVLQKIRRGIRLVANFLLRPLGAQVLSGTFADRARRATYPAGLRYLAGLGFAPATIIDVGVGYGTPELYQAFPTARHVLIEPLEEARPSIENIMKAFPRMEYVMAAAVRRSGRTTIHVHPDIARSSLYWESDYDRRVVQSRTVDAVTIDQVARTHGLAGPMLLKIDVQGAELDVLAGARKTLKHTECVILETSLYQFFKGGPLISDVVRHMDTIGFVVFDVWALQYRHDGTLLMIDLAFVKKKGALRGPDRFHPTPFAADGN